MRSTLISVTDDNHRHYYQISYKSDIDILNLVNQFRNSNFDVKTTTYYETDEDFEI